MAIWVSGSLMPRGEGAGAGGVMGAGFEGGSPNMERMGERETPLSSSQPARTGAKGVGHSNVI
jgi:hypothetical protein